MMNIYDALCRENGSAISGRTKLFVENNEEDGEITLYRSGILLTPENTGTMFIVDDWLIPQMDKLLFIDGELKVKDGEELIPPVKTEKELKREALLKQLAELDSQPTE